MSVPSSYFTHLLFTAWPTFWADRLLLVRGLSSKVKPEDLRPLFPGADEIVVAKDLMTTCPQVSKRKEKLAIKHGRDG